MTKIEYQATVEAIVEDWRYDGGRYCKPLDDFTEQLYRQRCAASGIAYADFIAERKRKPHKVIYRGNGRKRPNRKRGLGN